VNGSNTQGTVLALDVTTFCGWAVGPVSAIHPGKVSHGMWPLGKTDNLGRMMAELRGELSAAIAVHGPDFVVFEAPLPKTQTSARALIYLCGVVELVCFDRGVRCLEEHSGTVRKNVMGRGGAFKDERGFKVEAKVAVMNWARAEGFDPVDHNAADALALLRYVSNRMAA
jgi:hypothetical protein